ncbi:hypothetical protein ACQP2F_02885 [Actinoplanes sp. CA-030573]|uniref:hypothetical protein n=1 Tax=Actinoplanes sp. CA-030573 TaxID=3239898 RepID=UPI003D92D9FF
MTDQPRPPGRNWAGIAAMLGGIAALITAIVGVLTFVVAQLKDDKPDPAKAAAPVTTVAPRGTTAGPAGGASAPAAATGATAGATGGAATTASTGWQTVYSDVAFVFDNNGVDFAQDRPKRNAGTSMQLYSGGSSAVSYGSDSLIALLPSGQKGTPEACVDVIEAESSRTVQLAGGRRVCVQTPTGRVALMTVKGPAGPESSLGWKVTATAWQPAS